jgi:hypothetical protein
MRQTKNLNYFLKLNYNVVVKRVNDSYYLYIPELSLIAVGNDLKEAYKKIEQEKTKYFKRVINLGAEDTVKEPTFLAVKNKILTDLVLFFTKTLIVFFILFLLVLSGLPFLTNFFTNSIKQIPNTVSNLIFDYSDRLIKLPQDNKNKLRLRLKNVVKEIKPFTDEIQPLWQATQSDKLQSQLKP